MIRSNWAQRSSFHQVSARGQRGQIVLEYILLLVVGVTVATLVTTTMVSRSAESPGFLIKAWVAMINTIGSDTADDLSTAQ